MPPTFESHANGLDERILTDRVFRQGVQAQFVNKGAPSARFTDSGKGLETMPANRLLTMPAGEMWPRVSRARPG
jgi:hypothetical protein